MKKKALFFMVPLLTVVCQLSLMGQNAPQLGAKQFDAAARAAAVAYWTPERLQNAIPMDLLPVDQNVTSGSSAPPTVGEPLVSVPGQLPTFANSARLAITSSNIQASGSSGNIGIQGYTYPYPFTLYPVFSPLYDETIPPVYPYSTIGKVFFTIPGQGDFVCSASTSRPHLVLTARHCVFDYIEPSGGQFATNVVFFPGWHNGQNATLGGAWPARNLATWVTNAPVFRYDIGYIQTFDDDGVGCGGSAGGNPIEFYTGFLGFQFGGDYSSRHWDELGYPQAPPFDGTILIESESSTGAEDQFGQTDTIEVGSSLTGGASGGPWIIAFVPGPTGNINFANGVNSFKFTNPDHSLAINSPKFFDYNFNQLLILSFRRACLVRKKTWIEGYAGSTRVRYIPVVRTAGQLLGQST